jgi:DNA-binding winged helix-turn-helix (wHTH) protein/Tfp pilus assembly protein PilF
VTLDGREEPAALLFGDFELRLDSGELLRSGTPVKLQLRPSRVLALLALRAGEVVSREDIRREVWGEEHVDFDLALNYCIRQIRRALDDSTEQPRFLATLPRVGYRFVAPVEIRRRESPSRPAAPGASPAPPPSPARRASAPSRWLIAAALALLSLAGGLVALRESRFHPRQTSASGTPQISEEAMRVYLEGQYFAAHGDTEKAEDAYRRATTLAPRYAPAWAALAHELLEGERPAREVEPLLETAEQRALELDPELALAHLDRGERLFRYEYDWPKAEKELRRAVELDPQQAEAHYQYALLLAARGRHDEAIEQAGHALYLGREKQLIGARYSWFYYLARRYDEAIEKARRQIDLAPGKTSETNPTQPDLFWAFRTMLLASLAKGDRKAALEAARAEARWLGDPEPASLDEHWRYKERRFAQVGTPLPSSLIVPPIELGERERALDLLLEQCRERSNSMIPYLRVDPLYDSLRSHPRFRELLRCAHQEDGPG